MQLFGRGVPVDARGLNLHRHQKPQALTREWWSISRERESTMEYALFECVSPSLTYVAQYLFCLYLALAVSIPNLVGGGGERGGRTRVSDAVDCFWATNEQHTGRSSMPPREGGSRGAGPCLLVRYSLIFAVLIYIHFPWPIQLAAGIVASADVHKSRCCRGRGNISNLKHCTAYIRTFC